MATFNFDMHRIGQTIARLRREHNMTQMQLADEMGVSFQAVSNWERGQSMPDISKLPELAELFGTTIDALLGHHSPLIQKAAEDKLDELPEVNVEELTAAAPLLPPKQIESLTDTLMGLTNLLDIQSCCVFFPQRRWMRCFSSAWKLVNLLKSTLCSPAQTQWTLPPVHMSGKACPSTILPPS